MDTIIPFSGPILLHAFWPAAPTWLALAFHSALIFALFAAGIYALVSNGIALSDLRFDDKDSWSTIHYERGGHHCLTVWTQRHAGTCFGALNVLTGWWLMGGEFGNVASTDISAFVISAPWLPSYIAAIATKRADLAEKRSMVTVPLVGFVALSVVALSAD